jgi:uncharacterized protein
MMIEWEKILEAFEAGCVGGALPGPFARHETHGSVVLVSDKVAYKVKKPVTFDAFDYGSVELRGEMCRREIELNRRLAPDVYIRAAPVFAIDGGYVLGSEKDPTQGDLEPAEWVVVMAPIASDALLFRQVDTRLATAGDLERVGHRLGAFHAGAALVDPGHGDPAILRARLEGRLSLIEDLGRDRIDFSRLAPIRRLASAWLERHGGRLSDRGIDGWVRDGHGDLRLEHVVLLEDSVQVIDCVEFDASLRAADVLDDLAFLVMELELSGRSDLTAALVGSWAEEGCPLEEDLLWFFAAMKALVRVEVGIQRAIQLEAGYLREVVLETTRSLLVLAQKLLWRAHGGFAIVFSGFSGSGKTSLSRRLAQTWGFGRLASDETRKRLVGVDRDEVAPEGAYEDYVSLAVYESLGRLAAGEVRRGRTVVVDATFRRAADHSRFVRTMAEQGTAPLITFELRAHEDVLRTRVLDRTVRGGSDADISVLEAQLSADPAGSHLPSDRKLIDTSAPVDSVLAEIEDHLLAALDTV